MECLIRDKAAEVCSLYLDGFSVEAIAARFGGCSRTVRRVLSSNSVPRRTASEYHRLYECDHGFFETIDTEEKAYWLGFLAADGCVSMDGSKSPKIRVVLAAKDRAHLFRLRDSLKSSHPVYEEEKPSGGVTHLYCGFGLRSERMAGDLVRHGVTPRKTFDLRWPCLDGSLRRHYLRGYVDGDGSFYQTKPRRSRRPVLGFSVVGNDAFLSECLNFLVRSHILNRRNLQRKDPNSPIAALQVSGSRVVKRLGEFLYEGAGLYLPRKRNMVMAQLSLDI